MKVKTFAIYVQSDSLVLNFITENGLIEVELNLDQVLQLIKELTVTMWSAFALKWRHE